MLWYYIKRINYNYIMDSSDSLLVPVSPWIPNIYSSNPTFPVPSFA